MEKKLRKMKDRAAELFEKGKYRKAAELFQQIGNHEPDNPRWPQKAGEAHKKLGQSKAATGAFQQAARRYAEKGFLLKAIAMCNMILSLDPDHKETQTLLASYYAKQGGPPPQAKKPAARAVSGEIEAAAAAVEDRPVTPSPSSVEVEAIPVETTIEIEAEAPPPTEKRRTLPPGESLSAVKLNEVIVEAEPQESQEGQVFAIPLEEELETAFGDAFDLDEFEEIEIEAEPAVKVEPLAQKPPPDIPPTPIFSSLDRASLRSLIERVKVQIFNKGERIITQGDEDTSLYVLVEGQVGVFQEGDPRVLVTHLEEGAFFGEIALLTNHKRTATVEATIGSVVIEISREIVSDLIEEHPSVLKVLLRFFRYRLISSLMETSDLFAPFSQEEREKLAFHFDFIEADEGTVFVRQDEEADGLYILLTGELDTYRAQGQAVPLKPGDLFGATSLLSDEHNHATVRAASRCWLLKLRRDTFRKVIMTHPQVLAFLTDLVARRKSAIEKIEAEKKPAGLKALPTSEISLDLF